jgi:3-hydroxybutyryl-CoA dehydrogenase
MAIPARLDMVAVIGNGLIGHGVAQVFAAAGKQVRLVGRSEASLDRAQARIRESLARFVAHGLATAADADAAAASV